MTKTLNKSRYNPGYIIKSQNQPSKHITFTNLPQTYKASNKNFCPEMDLSFISSFISNKRLLKFFI